MCEALEMALRGPSRLERVLRESPACEPSAIDEAHWESLLSDAVGGREGWALSSGVSR